jgi:hypothetical protein
MALGPKELGSWANDSILSTQIRVWAGSPEIQERLVGNSDTEPAATDGTYGTHGTYGSLAAGSKSVQIVPDPAGRRSVPGDVGVRSSDDGWSVSGSELGSEKGSVWPGWWRFQAVG